MTTALVPFTAPAIDLAPSNKEFHKKNYKKNRNTLLSELRCISGIPEIASKLSQDTMYKLVSVPEGGKLYKDGAGKIKGVFTKDGKILKWAEFEAIRPSFVKAATAVGSQILLISIAMQLNRVEKGISRILDEIQSDRIAEIHSGVNQYNQAMIVQDSDRQSRMIEHAIQSLNTGIEKSIRSLKNQIEDTPDIKTGLFHNWGTKESKKATEKFALVEESFKTCLIGIKTLSECFSAINEPKAAATSLSSNLTNLKNSGIELAAQKARLVPFQGKRLPEEPWLKFLESESLFAEKIDGCNFFANKEFDRIEIELKPIELLEKNHE